MYGWLWRVLPGPAAARAAVLALLALATAALLWLVVFPWAAVHLPLDQSGLG